MRFHFYTAVFCTVLCVATARAEQPRSLPYLMAGPVEFDGQTSQTVGHFQLPGSFEVHAEIRVNESAQWNHVIEIGGLEHGFNAPLRLEVGDEGQWYVAVGDGASFAEADFAGNWRYGDWVKIAFRYDGSVGSFYEYDDQGGKNHLGDLQADLNVSQVAGTMILGSHQGGSRYFSGAVRQMNVIHLTGDYAGRFGLNMPGVVEFDGQTAYSLGSVTLPTQFYVTFDIRIDDSDEWDHVLEIGGLEHGFNAPLRLEVGDEGQWYVAVGDGASYLELETTGNWEYGQWRTVTFIYDGLMGMLIEDTAGGQPRVSQGQVFESPMNSGEHHRLIGTLAPADRYNDPPTDPAAVAGTLILGGFKGEDRFFNGAIRNLQLGYGCAGIQAQPDPCSLLNSWGWHPRGMAELNRR